MRYRENERLKKINSVHELCDNSNGLKYVQLEFSKGQRQGQKDN